MTEKANEKHRADGEMCNFQPLEHVVAQIGDAGRRGRVCVRDVVETIGARSFGPLLLVPGLLVLSPLSGIPGVPTVAGVLIVLVAGQMLIGRDTIWMPRLICRRCISKTKLAKAVAFLHRPARIADRIVKPRLTFLIRKPFAQLIAATCCAMGVLMPPLELLPFMASVCGAAVSTFALALVAHDGVIAMFAFAISMGGIFLGLYAFA